MRMRSAGFLLLALLRGSQAEVAVGAGGATEELNPYKEDGDSSQVCGLTTRRSGGRRARARSSSPSRSSPS